MQAESNYFQRDRTNQRTAIWRELSFVLIYQYQDPILWIPVRIFMCPAGLPRVTISLRLSNYLSNYIFMLPLYIAISTLMYTHMFLASPEMVWIVADHQWDRTTAAGTENTGAIGVEVNLPLCERFAGSEQGQVFFRVEFSVFPTSTTSPLHVYSCSLIVVVKCRGWPPSRTPLFVGTRRTWVWRSIISGKYKWCFPCRDSQQQQSTGQLVG